MSSSLLHADEEADMGVYGAYLRAQTDTDLMDTALHVIVAAVCLSLAREARPTVFVAPAKPAFNLSAGVQYHAGYPYQNIDCQWQRVNGR